VQAQSKSEIDVSTLLVEVLSVWFELQHSDTCCLCRLSPEVSILHHHLLLKPQGCQYTIGVFVEVVKALLRRRDIEAIIAFPPVKVSAGS
jgi:hypothetical protein